MQISSDYLVVGIFSLSTKLSGRALCAWIDLSHHNSLYDHIAVQ